MWRTLRRVCCVEASLSEEQPLCCSALGRSDQVIRQVNTEDEFNAIGGPSAAHKLYFDLFVL